MTDIISIALFRQVLAKAVREQMSASTNKASANRIYSSVAMCVTSIRCRGRMVIAASMFDHHVTGDGVIIER